jgi:uncharacterized RDD family membrane protein YckC
MNEQMQEEESIFPEAEIKIARFWPRLGAYLLDSIIISLVTLPVTYLNVTSWKMPAFFILTAVIELAYKPFMEYQYGATLGKMAVGISVTGHNFEKVTLKEELKRVSFYLIPGILQSIFTLRIYFNSAFNSISNFNEYNQFVVSLNPATVWVVVIVFILFIADILVFLSNEQNQSLHDIYAGTYVIEKPRATIY